MIPPELGTLSNLNTLDLRFNPLSGQLPLEFSGIGISPFAYPNPPATAVNSLNLTVDLRNTSLSGNFSPDICDVANGDRLQSAVNCSTYFLPNISANGILTDPNENVRLITPGGALANFNIRVGQSRTTIPVLAEQSVITVEGTGATPFARIAGGLSGGSIDTVTLIQDLLDALQSDSTVGAIDGIQGVVNGDGSWRLSIPVPASLELGGTENRTLVVRIVPWGYTDVPESFRSINFGNISRFASYTIPHVEKDLALTRILPVISVLAPETALFENTNLVSETLEVTLRATVDEAVRVPLTFGGDASSDDYFIQNSQFPGIPVSEIIFPAGSSQGDTVRLEIRALNDDALEGLETLRIAFSIDGRIVPPEEVEFTIQDDETLDIEPLPNSAYVFNENDGTVLIPFSLSGILPEGQSAELTARASIDGDTAVENEDYRLLINTLVYPDPDNTNGEYFVSVVLEDDNIVEDNETFTVYLVSDVIDVDGSIPVTIEDDDFYRIGFTSDSLNRSVSEDVGTVEFTIELVPPLAGFAQRVSSAVVTVELDNTDAASIISGDTLTFTQDIRSNTVRLNINRETQPIDSDILVTLTLTTEEERVRLEPGELELLITDDDAAPDMVSLTPVDNAQEGEIVTLTVAVSGSAVAVDVVLVEGTADADDYTLLTDSLIVPDEQPRIMINTDNLFEGDESFTVELRQDGRIIASASVGIASNGSVIVGPLRTTVTAQESDGQALIPIGVIGGDTITDSSPSFSVRINTQDNSATAPSDYIALRDQILEFGPAVRVRTLVVTLVSDNVDEGLEFVDILVDAEAPVERRDGARALVIRETVNVCTLYDTRVLPLSVETRLDITECYVQAGLASPAVNSVTFNESASSVISGSDDFRFIESSIRFTPRAFAAGTTGEAVFDIVAEDGLIRESISLRVQFVPQETCSFLRYNVTRDGRTVPLAVPALECQALVALYNSANGQNWTNNANAGWLESTLLNNWANVEVTLLADTAHVRAITLDTDLSTPTEGSVNVIGNLPDELGNLPYLEVLSIQSLLSPAITGFPTPSTLGKLTSLRELRLPRNNAIIGFSELMMLTELEVLDLPSSSGFNTQMFLNEAGDTLFNLRILDLLLADASTINVPTINVPESLGSLTNLEALRFGTTANITGTIPYHLQDLDSQPSIAFSAPSTFIPEFGIANSQSDVNGVITFSELNQPIRLVNTDDGNAVRGATINVEISGDGVTFSQLSTDATVRDDGSWDYFLPENLTPGQYYLRIRQTLRDSVSDYSNTISFRIDPIARDTSRQFEVDFGDNSIRESSGVHMITISPRGILLNPFTVRMEVISLDNNFQSGDYELGTNNIIDFPVGSTEPQTFTLRILNDDIFESAESFRVNLFSVRDTGDELLFSNEYNVLDDEIVVLGFPDDLETEYRVVEDDGVQLILPVTLVRGSLGPGEEISVRVISDNADEAEADLDYLFLRGRSMTFTEDIREQQIRIVIPPDVLSGFDELEEKFSIILTSDDSGVTFTRNRVNVTIIDEFGVTDTIVGFSEELEVTTQDDTRVSRQTVLSEDGLRRRIVAQEGETLTVQVRLSETTLSGLLLPVSLDLDTVGLDEEDYSITVSDGTLRSFAIDDPVWEFDVEISDDAIYDSGKIILSLTPLDITREVASIVPSVLEISVADSIDNPPVVRILTAPADVVEGETITFEVIQSDDTGISRTARAVLVPVTSDDRDYTILEDIITIPSGDPSDITPNVVEVSIFDDTILEGEETAIFRLVDAGDDSVLAETSFRIIDNDTVARVGFEPNVYPSYELSDSVTVRVGFVGGSGIAPGGPEVQVRVFTEDRTAQAGSDYEAIEDMILTFSSEISEHFVTVNLLQDAVTEGIEEFALLVRSLDDEVAVGTREGLFADEALVVLGESPSFCGQNEFGFINEVWNFDVATCFGSVASLGEYTIEFNEQLSPNVSGILEDTRGSSLIAFLPERFEGEDDEGNIAVFDVSLELDDRISTHSVRMTAGFDEERSCLNTFNNPTEMIAILPTECSALVSLFNSTNGRNWVSSQREGWLRSRYIEDWEGVTTTSDLNGRIARVNTLDLSQGGLQGILPASIDAFSNLETLDLSGNRLVGGNVLPPSIGNLANLEILDLSGNSVLNLANNTRESLSAIPPDIGRLLNLRELDLSFNPSLHTSRSFPVPQELNLLSNLRVLNFEGDTRTFFDAGTHLCASPFRDQSNTTDA